jgi:hypothetical protein
MFLRRKKSGKWNSVQKTRELIKNDAETFAVAENCVWSPSFPRSS